MSPSSSPSEPEPFGFLVAAGPVAAATTASAWLQAMLDAEAALALAEADVGLIPAAAAERIADACRVERFDVGAVLDDGRPRRQPGHRPGPPRCAALVGDRRRRPRPSRRHQPGHRRRGHRSRRRPLRTRRRRRARRGAGAVAVELGDRYGDTPMIARTLGQHAVPTTFATVTARWADGLGEAAAGLTAPAVSLGGPSGDGTSYGEHRDAILERFAARLGLIASPSVHHSQRMATVVTAGQWAVVATAAGKVALDVIVLAQSDVGELSEVADGAGASSSMAHKRNPIAAISARAAAMQAPGLVATLVQAAGSHELERAAGAWHAEWPALNQLLRSAGSAVEWVHRSLDRVVVHADRMKANLP